MLVDYPNNNQEFASNMNVKKLSIVLLSLFFFTSCSGGSSSGGNDGQCSGACPEQALSIEDVNLILKQTVHYLEQTNTNATISIVDRVGNVLAVYQSRGAVKTVNINGAIGAIGGLEGANVPSTLAAISKAGTAAYLSSQGNAFSTRTASQIIQEHFNPGELKQAGGPLFGVQFSQLICSDIMSFGENNVGPKALPLGLSADSGGLPLYKSGSVVGGIGVEINGVYSLDRNIRDIDPIDANIEEYVAMAGSAGFNAPSSRRADAINVGGRSLRYADVSINEESLVSLPEIDNADLVVVAGFFNGIVRPGATFGTNQSGIANSIRAGLPSSQLVNADGGNRVPLRNGSSLGGLELTANEVNSILDSAITVSANTRAAIRNPLDSQARVSIWIVDHLGNPLGFTRSQDAPVFGIDVALQKARTAAFFSSPDAINVLSRIQARESGKGSKVEDYSSLFNANIGSSYAISSRAIGNISRPFFPDGIDGTLNGIFSLPYPGVAVSGTGRSWSPFNNGIQLDFNLSQILAPLSGVVPNTCVDSSAAGLRLGNGIQIFPGGVPIYRNNNLIGAIGVSGDGVDQDDLIAYYSISREGLNNIGQTSLGDPVYGFNAPKEIRSDNIVYGPSSIRLRYVNCPEAPFLNSNSQKICD